MHFLWHDLLHLYLFICVVFEHVATVSLCTFVLCPIHCCSWVFACIVTWCCCNLHFWLATVALLCLVACWCICMFGLLLFWLVLLLCWWLTFASSFMICCTDFAWWSCTCILLVWGCVMFEHSIHVMSPCVESSFKTRIWPCACVVIFNVIARELNPIFYLGLTCACPSL